MSVNRAYFVLGSNIDPERNLLVAGQMLSSYGRVTAVSRVWESAPVDLSDQPNFLNAAVLLESALPAPALCREAIPTIERSLNRIRDPENKNGPRTIDVDLTLFNRDILRINGRCIPDADLLVRAFVAVPLAELEPGYMHPETGETLAGIADQLRRSSSPLRLRPDVVLNDPAQKPLASPSRQQNGLAPSGACGFSGPSRSDAGDDS